jgi:hypothetical protein|tara:strand:+ start:715 stop:951 length:237 start_codon:yes stop_codon:yes gene_type:complete
MLKQKNRRHGLSKYDAPLRIQFEKGVIAFNRGFIKSPYNINTMQYREWQRGFNFAYAKNLKKVKENENRRRGKEIYGR